MKQKSVIKLKNNLLKNKKKGIAVDIDETICNTCESLISEAINKFGKPKENLTAYELFKKYKYLKNIPSWKENQEIKLWVKQILNDELFFENAKPFKEIIQNLEKIQKKYEIVAYITARGKSLHKVTLDWLNKYNFPKAELILKPDNLTQGNLWKAKVLEYLYPEIIGIIDDNPKLGEEVSKNYKGKIYLLSYENHEFESNKNIPCKDWDTVYKKIK